MRSRYGFGRTDWNDGLWPTLSDQSHPRAFDCAAAGISEKHIDRAVLIVKCFVSNLNLPSLICASGLRSIRSELLLTGGGDVLICLRLLTAEVVVAILLTGRQ